MDNTHTFVLPQSNVVRVRVFLTYRATTRRVLLFFIHDDGTLLSFRARRHVRRFSIYFVILYEVVWRVRVCTRAWFRYIDRYEPSENASTFTANIMQNLTSLRVKGTRFKPTSL